MQHSCYRTRRGGPSAARPLLFPPSRIGAAGASGAKINLVRGDRLSALPGTSGSHLTPGRGGSAVYSE
jgi:hypothetical protein